MVTVGLVVVDFGRALATFEVVAVLGLARPVANGFLVPATVETFGFVGKALETISDFGAMLSTVGCAGIVSIGASLKFASG